MALELLFPPSITRSGVVRGAKLPEDCLVGFCEVCILFLLVIFLFSFSSVVPNRWSQITIIACIWRNNWKILARFLDPELSSANARTRHWSLSTATVTEGGNWWHQCFVSSEIRTKFLHPFNLLRNSSEFNRNCEGFMSGHLLEEMTEMQGAVHWFRDTGQWYFFDRLSWSSI